MSRWVANGINDGLVIFKKPRQCDGEPACTKQELWHCRSKCVFCLDAMSEKSSYGKMSSASKFNRVLTEFCTIDLFATKLLLHLYRRVQVAINGTLKVYVKTTICLMSCQFSTSAVSVKITNQTLFRQWAVCGVGSRDRLVCRAGRSGS